MPGYVCPYFCGTVHGFQSCVFYTGHSYFFSIKIYNSKKHIAGHMLIILAPYIQKTGAVYNR